MRYTIFLRLLKVLGEEDLALLQQVARDHAVLLVSDPSVIPPRREVRVLVEASGPEDVKAVSKLVKEYSGARSW